MSDTIAATDPNTRKRCVFAAFAAVAFLLNPVGVPAAPAPLAVTAQDLPPADRLLVWSPTQQEIGYRSMEKIFPTRPIIKGNHVHALPEAATEMPVRFIFNNRPYTLDDYLKALRTSGLLVIKDGRILIERYGLGRTRSDRWTSFSMAKSVTSTLIAAAIKDGAIQSIDDPLGKYLPALRGGVYAGVTIRQALLMSSGVAWNEDYDDPASDVTRLFQPRPQFLAWMSGLPRVAAPGAKFHYNTGETTLLGAVVAAATGKHLSDYFSAKVWARYGMEQDGFWVTTPDGEEVGGCCLSATLRDYGRLGLFMLEQYQATGDRSILPAGWMKTATSRLVDPGYGPKAGYGYQWWTEPGSAFAAVGVMGQRISIDPATHSVIVIQSAWNSPGSDAEYDLEHALVAAIRASFPDTTAR